MTQRGRRPEVVFADLYPMLYAADTPISGGYRKSSELSAAFASQALGGFGLCNKRVLDIGCGYGTTSMTIAAYDPAEINAVDNSRGMIELLNKVLLSNDPLDPWLREKQVPEVLGSFYEITLKHFESMRAEFQTGMFYRKQGMLLPFTADILSFRLDREVDTVIGNNFFHWPINQRLAELRKETPDGGHELLERACRDAFLPFIGVLKKPGILVLMEPSDFVAVEDQVEDAYIEQNSLVSHPVFIQLHSSFNRILKEEYGIERGVPGRTPLFRQGEFLKMAESVGLQALGVHRIESVADCNPLDFFFVRIPLVTGNLKISFEEKIKLGERVRNELTKTLTPEELNTPIRAQWFFFVFERK